MNKCCGCFQPPCVSGGGQWFWSDLGLSGIGGWTLSSICVSHLLQNKTLHCVLYHPWWWTCRDWFNWSTVCLSVAQMWILQQHSAQRRRPPVTAFHCSLSSRPWWDSYIHISTLEKGAQEDKCSMINVTAISRVFFQFQLFLLSCRWSLCSLV